MRLAASLAFFPLVALLAGACVVGDEALDDDETEVGDDEVGMDEVGTDSRWTPEVVEVDGIGEAAADNELVIAATARHKWRIKVLSGFGASTADFGDGNAPDLYVKRFCGGAYRNRTGVATNSVTPYWQSTLVSSEHSDSYIKSCYLELWDADSNGDDFGGRVYLAPYINELLNKGYPIKDFRLRFTANDDMTVIVSIMRVY